VAHADPPRPGRPARGHRRLRDPPRHQPAQRGSDPAAGHPARRQHRDRPG
jgi:hypothetical protein